ncbi:hypothetical protein AB839_07410 [Stenotrophomonas sp. DDT-1]|uniref:response regulator transcription factor n=1 Tax=Stenotrophomonas TaxID=40323 RepID=UPI000776D1F0|nr:MULTISPECIES: response regulator transcription factor [Stenotrophomonas]KXU97452.1 hypothetical protein AB839_07410 [Stenotrophomonas sp. DDT-1]MDQ4681011.1 response regulator transcription factor [Stenotrophomonas maltophilia group sp. RNC7]PSD12067.1 DNA-binding response regulator [Stenotrophomonas maltophilia]UGB20736.1 response regulator transcription factor [Stenotrophomonas maltophilia]
MIETQEVALRVIVLEGDEFVRDCLLLSHLRVHGFDVAGSATVAGLEALMEVRHADVVVLAVDLPDGDGFNVVHLLRQRHPALGVVMLTGRQGTTDRVRGLVQGADAYLTKPVDINVLVATLYSLGRRLQQQNSPEAERYWRLDPGAWRLLPPRGGGISLTRSERALLRNLFAQPGDVVPREHLIAALTPDVFDFDPHRLDSLIHRLRRKVRAACGGPLPLTTVHGEGYVFNPWGSHNR